jgi:hypothetical protein
MSLERKGVHYTIWVFGTLIILSILSYLAFLKNIPGFADRYAIWVLYLIVSVTAIGSGLWYFFSYKGKVTCMNGMMIGMTFGMQTGMMIGAVIGATNGFFIGSLAGMLLGVCIGTIAGRCCGVMGVMEGMMAGLMGGTMGPMISVMMFSDHLDLFMPIYMIVNLTIIGGLAYMLKQELYDDKATEKREVEFVTFAGLAVVVTFFLTMLMVYGPKSALLA